jgi:hypothetical protein
VPIRDHKAFFEYERSSSVRLVVDKNGILQDSTLDLDVIHEVSSGDKSEKSFLGRVKVNVAEYVEATRYSQEQVQRRYLLQESKVNSTIKVCYFKPSDIQELMSIGWHSYESDGRRPHISRVNFSPGSNYDWSSDRHRPPLRSAPVFVGIAGVMAGEQAENKQPGGSIVRQL